jgi:4-diphosphocytidyl-2-C-methyl-D-erythritol kinase
VPAFSAPAKLNLFLHITGQRADGYHLLQTVFQMLDYGDTVNIEARQDEQITRSAPIPGVPEEQDITLRAAKLLQQTTGCKLGADISVEKHIPMGGGLGGGSSDAATVLLALNRLWKLDLPRTTLMELALQLGADVPVFIFGQPAWAEGIGEQLQAIRLEPAYYAVLTPSIGVSTASIFASRELTRDTIPQTMAAFFKGFGHNDLESLVCRMYPQVAACLDWLKQFGDARMSGSGSSVFVEVDSLATAQNIVDRKPVGTNGFAAGSLDQHPLHYCSD